MIKNENFFFGGRGGRGCWMVPLWLFARALDLKENSFH